MEFRTLLLLPLYSTDNTVFIPGGILTEVILMKNSINARDVSEVWVEGHLFIQPSFWKFWLERKLNRPFWFSLARIFDNTFEGGPLWTVLLVWLKWLFPFDIIVVPATAHLYPAYNYLPKHTVAWVWGLHNWNVVSVPLGVRNFSKFWTRIFVEWNAP